MLAITFGILDFQSVSTGDDLGYMFTDSRLHAGDGYPVGNLVDIIDTQRSHFLTTNGRFIVHSVVQFFVAIAGTDIFRIINSIMFATLWWACMLLCFPPRRRTPGKGIVTALLMWLMLPRPGVTMLSLVAFAVNYLWCGVANLLYLVMLRKWHGGHTGTTLAVRCLLFAAAMAAGSLQESYSLPVAGILLVLLCMRRLMLRGGEGALVAGYGCGAIVLLCAPGNYSHLAVGGGLTSAGLANKIGSLGAELATSPLLMLALVIVIWAIADRHECGKFCHRHIIFLGAILIALLLAALSYTAVRQLFAPSLFCTCVFASLLDYNGLARGLVRRAADTKAFITACTLLLAYTLVGAWHVRTDGANRMKSLLGNISAGKSIVYPTRLSRPDDASAVLFPPMLFDRFKADPFADRDLKLIFDRYTRVGLSRIEHSNRADAISAILPCPPGVIIAAAATSSRRGDTIVTSPLDRYFRCFVLPADTSDAAARKITRLRTRDYGRPPFTRFRSADSTYYIVPATATTIIATTTYKRK